MAYQPDKPRHIASAALIRLRTEMGMSQSQFASEVLQVSRVTVAAYESSKPPTTAFLKKLEAIAKREKERCKQERDPAKYLKFRELQQTFYELQFAELKERAGVDYKFFSATEGRKARGFAFLEVEGYTEIMSLQSLVALWRILRLAVKNNDEELARKVTQAIDQLSWDLLGSIDYETYKKNDTTSKALEIIPRLTITRKPKKEIEE